jgi:hypothetical protein
MSQHVLDGKKLRCACHRVCSGRRVEQISNELKDFYYVEGLEEVRVIRDRQTSTIIFCPICAEKSDMYRKITATWLPQV